MCRGSSTWIDKWGEVKPKYDPWRTEEEVLESGVIEETEAQIKQGKMIYEGKKHKQPKVKNKKLDSMYYRHWNDHVSFYAPFGEKECVCATKWCEKYCHLKSVKFDKEVEKQIQSTNIKNFNINDMPEIINGFERTNYITVFSSGSVENLGKNMSKSTNISWGEYLKEIVNKNKNKKIRFLIKDVYEGKYLNLNLNFEYYIPKLSKNGVIILSLDATSPKGVLKEALKNKNIKGISIVNHKDNKELIDILKNKTFLAMYNVKNVINCEDCIIDDNCDKMLCFNQKERFVLIQKFKN